MRLRLFKPLFKLFNLSKSRIYLCTVDSCWVEVLKNLTHLKKTGVKGGAFNFSTHLNVKL